MAKAVQAVVFVNSNNDAVVFPPVVLAAKADDIELVNMTGDDILVIYPANVFDKDGAGPQPIDPNKTSKLLNDKSKHGRKVHNGGTPVQGRFPYKVFSFKTNALAQGNSDPEFIIE
jgi:hypothetical protein